MAPPLPIPVRTSCNCSDCKLVGAPYHLQAQQSPNGQSSYSLTAEGDCAKSTQPLHMRRLVTACTPNPSLNHPSG
eukprot:5096171-Amphidinium_carterae.1